jgi:hypothetical protein
MALSIQADLARLVGQFHHLNHRRRRSCHHQILQDHQVEAKEKMTTARLLALAHGPIGGRRI